jgi:hypothetical protein
MTKNRTPGLSVHHMAAILTILCLDVSDFIHYLVVAKVRERLAVSKQFAQKFEGERFNLKKLNELEVRKQYQVEITNRLAALENLDNDGDINRAWENIKETI